MPLNRLLTVCYVVRIVCYVSLPSFLTWVSLVISYLDQRQMQIACSAQHHSHWQERQLTDECVALMKVGELHVNATYAQHLHWNQFMEKSQPVIGSKLFSSYRTVFELAHIKNMIILKISVGYFVRIRRNCSSNVRLKTPKLGFKVNLYDF